MQRELPDYEKEESDNLSGLRHRQTEVPEGGKKIAGPFPVIKKSNAAAKYNNTSGLAKKQGLGFISGRTSNNAMVDMKKVSTIKKFLSQ